MGARHEREHEWIDTAVLPKKPGLHNDYATGDQYDDGEIEQSTQKETEYQTPSQVFFKSGVALHI